MKAICVAMCVLAITGRGRCQEDEDFEGEVMEMDRNAQIANIELETKEAMRRAEPFRQRYVNLKEEQRRVDNGWFRMGDRARAMQPYVDEAEREWRQAQREVDILRAQIKPLYGVISVQHLQEHRETIYESFQYSVELGKNQLWWDLILGHDNSDSLEGVLLRMLTSFLAGVSIGYVIGLIKFILTAPFTIVQYCSSIIDVPAALFMWAFGVFLFLLPLIGLYLTCVAVSSHRRREAENILRPRMIPSRY
eukprot:TRINITY_DN11766_c0_g1_i1.p1 TRINITY_DN11766_c0_g1~~TRINITY_DN11766_c0_g1_i1.p1  ORF type:complete len:250 (+),score=52.86 TRINITY_DN11766_c0_g1_i1:85-834(+)